MSLRDPSPATPADVLRPLSRRGFALAIALVLFHLALAWTARIPGIGWGEDDVAYISLGQELRHFGYREVQDVAAPIHARFPPAFPASIAVWGALFTDHVDALLALVALWSALGLIFFFDAARRAMGEQVALVTLALVVVNPGILRYAGRIMAEAQYLALSAIALWAMVREEEDTRFTVLAGAASIAAALTRTAGLVLVGALGVYWLWRRRYRTVVIYGACVLMTVGAWLGWTIMAPDAEHRRLYVADLGLNTTVERHPLVNMVRRFPLRATRLFTRLLPASLALPTIPGTVIDNVVGVLVSLLLFAAGGIVLLRRWLAAAVYVVFYGGLLVLWRYAVDRFTYPVVPFFLLLLVAGCWQLTSRFGPRIRGVATALIAILVLAGSAGSDVPTVREALACDRADPAHDDACWTTEERAYLRAAQWARDSVPAGAIFFVNKERGFWYHSGHLTINQDRALEEDSASLAPYLRATGARYVVTTRVGTKSLQHGRLVASACHDMVLVKDFEDGVALLRVRDPDEAEDPRACAVVQWWRDLPVPEDH
jgi:Dolichyl-phosphate-mannose-protein mannosyltransferase